jgi:hypothetical protein
VISEWRRADDDDWAGGVDAEAEAGGGGGGVRRDVRQRTALRERRGVQRRLEVSLKPEVEARVVALLERRAFFGKGPRERKKERGIRTTCFTKGEKNGR